jgi:hypothetical protein
MQWIIDNAEGLLLAVSMTIALSAHIAALTPTKRDDQAVGWVRKIFDLLAGNYGHAKNR